MKRTKEGLFSALIIMVILFIEQLSFLSGTQVTTLILNFFYIAYRDCIAIFYETDCRQLFLNLLLFSLYFFLKVHKKAAIFIDSF
jgi:hypothetical protein